MKQKLECETVRDLLPLYVDHLTSEASGNSIEEHMNGCAECREVLEQMGKKLEVDTAPEVTDFKKYLNRSKRNIFYLLMGIMAALAVISCFIVDLAISGRLTWSLIVDGSILCAYLSGYVFVITKRHRLIKAAAVLNLCTFLLLALIQVILYYVMKMGTLWFWTTALPITALWSVLAWITIGCKVIFKLNVCIALSILCFLSVFGNAFTNIWTGSYEGVSDYLNHFISNGLGTLLGAIVFFIIGIVWQSKWNSHNGKDR